MSNIAIKINNIELVGQWEWKQYNTECVICLSKIEEDDLNIINGKCLHAFHKECLNKWLEKKNKCPICKDQWESIN